MRTNTSMTLFHKRYNPITRLDEWDRYNIAYVMWQGGEGANIDKGYEKSNDIKIWIPYKINAGLESVLISIGDIVVKGKITNNITKQSDLTCENYNILTKVDNNYGSKNAQHVYIGAK